MEVLVEDWYSHTQHSQDSMRAAYRQNNFYSSYETSDLRKFIIVCHNIFHLSLQVAHIVDTKYFKMSNFWAYSMVLLSSFPVIHKVGNVDIFVLLKFETK